MGLTAGQTVWATNTDHIESRAAATTTEVLTGTATNRTPTPDSVAALWEKGSDIASAATLSVGEGGYFFVTGTTTITDIDFATDKAGRKVWLKFSGILTLTHHSTTLILPTGANIVTAAGDTACFVSEGSDNVRCVSYQRADGTPLVGGGSGNITAEVYIANVFQSGTSDPTADVGDNTLGGTVVWTRTDVGEYAGTLTGAFVIPTMPFFSYDNNGTAEIIQVSRVTDNFIEIKSFDGSMTPTDIDGGGVSLMVLVYP